MNARAGGVVLAILVQDFFARCVFEMLAEHVLVRAPLLRLIGQSAICLEDGVYDDAGVRRSLKFVYRCLGNRF